MLQSILQSRTLSGADAINALRPFYFAVHPDFFGQHPKERVKNLLVCFLCKCVICQGWKFSGFPAVRESKVVLERNTVVTREQKDVLSLF